MKMQNLYWFLNLKKLHVNVIDNKQNLNEVSKQQKKRVKKQNLPIQISSIERNKEVMKQNKLWIAWKFSMKLKGNLMNEKRWKWRKYLQCLWYLKVKQNIWERDRERKISLKIKGL